MTTTVFEDPFSEEVWKITYKDHNDDTIDDTLKRVATFVASAEEDESSRGEWTEKFYEMLSDFKCTAGGRIYANAGTEFGGTTLMNCFVSPRNGPDIDSLPKIVEDILNQCQTLKSEGGWGQNFSWIRPRGAFIHGIGVETPGAVKYMEIYDKTSDVITSGSGSKSKNKKAKGRIRKGAMMGVLDCIAGNTPINTLSGKVPVKDLVGRRPYLYCTDGQGNVLVRQAELIWSKGVKKTIRVVFDNDDFIECTPEHEFMLKDGSFKKAKNLSYGESLAALNKRLINDYLNLSITGSRKTIAEHNAVYEMKYGAYPTILTEQRNSDCTVAHHVDHVKWNNIPDNIQQMTFEEHSRHHSDHIRKHQKERASRQKGTTWEEFYGEEKANKIKMKYVSKRKGSDPWNKGMKGDEYKSHYKNGFGGWAAESPNHKVVRIEECGEQEVFDISMPSPYHNFAANGVFIHNCWHPDIIEFITAKQQPGRLTKFNVSVNCTDDFMEAVKNDQEWDLRFPDTTFENYKGEWDGNLKKWEEKGYPVKVYRTVSATWLWNLILESTYNRAEPGVLFLDRANHFNPLNYFETIAATNPCLVGDTLIPTQNGLICLDELVDQFEGGNPVECLSSDLKGTLCFRAISNVVRSGVKQTITLHLSNGMQITSTPDHKFWTGSEWCEARLCQGKMFDLVSQYRFSDNYDFNFEFCSTYTGKNNREYFTNLPTKWTEDLALVLGWLVGDGWITDTGAGFIFGKDDQEMCERFRRIFNKWGCSVSEVVDNHHSITLYLTSSVVKQLFENLGVLKVKSSEKRVPSSIFKSPKNIVSSFLRGLFSADGSVLEMKNSNFWVSLCSSSRLLLNDVQHLLLMYGITHHKTYDINKTSVFKYTTVRGEERQYIGNTYHDLRIYGHGIITFFEEIGFSLTRKHQMLSNIQGKRFKKKQPSVVVVDIEEAGPKDVYDITEPVFHNFVANGVVVHNCGEQTLASGGVCNLGSINLTQFVLEDGSGFDLEKIKKYVRYLNRFLDNINSLSSAPLPEYVDSMRMKRRVGIGILGWGSALFMMKTRFGSRRASDLREQVMSTIACEAYMSSIDLAEEKGMFKYCDPDSHANNSFVKSLNLPIAYIDKLRKVGIRNSSLLSIQPTGNTSIFANIASGGLEPIFLPEYVRTVIVGEMPEHIADVTPKWYESEWHETEMFKFTKEGDEEILKGVDSSGVVYKIDKNRGLTKEVVCEDYGVRWLKARDEWDPKARWAVTTANMSVKDHINDLKGFARWVDSAMSKTVNVPYDYPFEDFKDIYLEAYNSGFVKGVTTYRSGTMTTVLSAKEDRMADSSDEEIILDDVKVPTQAPAVVNTIRGDGKKWYLTTIMDDQQRRPIAFFVHTNHHEKTVTTHDAVEYLIQLAKDKRIPARWIYETIVKMEKDTNATKIARAISLNLRHGVLIKNVVSVLDRVENVFVGSFLFQIKKYLATFIKDGEKVEGEKCLECGSENIVFSEGCKKCMSCGSSKCG